MSVVEKYTSGDDARKQSLRDMKLVALGFLGVAMGGLLLSVSMGGQGGWAWLKVFCEAAAVGALADWFAVVALFRRPLGLPIPHTAIIPASKVRIADNLAEFVRDHFLSPQVLLTKLAVFNPSARLGHWLREPQNLRSLSGSIRTVAIEALDFIDEASVRQAVSKFVMQHLKDWDASATASNVLQLLTRNGRHHELLDGALQRVAEYLQTEENRETVARLMLAYVRKEWPNIVSMVDLVSNVNGIATRMSERLAQQIVTELQQVLSDSKHPMRQKYEQWIQEFIDRLRQDPVMGEQIKGIKDRAIAHEDVQRYVQGIWDEALAALRSDLQRQDSALLQRLEHGLAGIGERLAQDPSLAASINEHVIAAAGKLAESLRAGVTQHISQTLKAWDDRQFVQQIELGVGKDLQFIRLNGTVVGGCAGLVLHALLQFV